MAVEPYAEISHGLFPRFLVASALLAVGTYLVQIAESTTFSFLVSDTNLTPTSLTYYRDAASLVGNVYIPFFVFAAFYLVGRVRIVLERDYAGVALSILLGALAVDLVLAFLTNLGSQESLLGLTVENVGSALADSILFTFIGFSAIVLSYLRRL